MFIRTILVISYTLSCLCLLVPPWRFFHLNKDYFNKQKGIYSKQAINDLIPEPYQLRQWFDHAECEPETYPVFVKPEWGQNSKGVQRVDSLDELKAVRRKFLASSERLPLLVQESAKGLVEFEVFVLANAKTTDDYACLSITQVVNTAANPLPVNGIHNKDTSYLDISDDFSSAQRHQLWLLLVQVGHFNVCRFGIKADSKADMLAGHFNIIEINLLLPMPMVLLTTNRSLKEKIDLAIHLSWKMALLTRSEVQYNWLRRRSHQPLMPTTIAITTKQGER
jgi:hypothetical protein